MSSRQIAIQSLKYGNRLHYEWKTTLLEKSDTYMVVLGEIGRKLHHYTKQKVFTVDNWTIEFFSTELWFTVSADVACGQITQYYCNINMPSRFDGEVVSFVDLDLDLIQRDGEWKVVDEDEFAQNAVKFGYPKPLVQKTREELQDLQRRIAEREFPFDGTLERFIPLIPG